MAMFPRTEIEVYSLVTSMLNGFGENSDIYPSPPVDKGTLNNLMEDYSAAKNSQTAAIKQALTTKEIKDIALKKLVTAMKNNIRYAEAISGCDNEKLKRIGWGARKNKNAPSVPGQVRELEISKGGDNCVYLNWKKPVDGGKIRVYKIMRRESPENSWMEVATALVHEITLFEQPKDRSLEYCIIAANACGEGQCSNIVVTVL